MTIRFLLRRFSFKSTNVRSFFFLLVLFTPRICSAQTISEETKYIFGLKRTDVAPDGLLSSRAAVLFSVEYSEKELSDIQKGFQQIGIDAVVYVESERVLAGMDLKNAYTGNFIRRDIHFLIFMSKENQEFQFFFLPMGSRNNWTRAGQSAWFLHSNTLPQILTTVYRSIVSTQKRQSFLINDYPEQGVPLKFIADNRNETMVPNLRSFKIAVPKMGDASVELNQFLKEKFPMNYEMTDDTVSEKDLIQKGYRYVLRYVHAGGALAKEMMGYDMSKSESALVTVTYNNGKLQLKTIPSQTLVYKFYLKDLEDRGLYFGTKWDADLTWQDALKNHLDAYRAAGRLN
jgi:hypothetical protein